MKTAEVRKKFLEFFRSKGHEIVASSSLVPSNDPTLLFSNAGMNQFKDLFLGVETRDYTRATTSQKCLRISGKHNDLENVGVTARHHTFFEMLGNFSFGDYFKQDAIAYAWEFVTEVLKLDVERLWVTIYEDDDETGKLWEEIGVAKDRILKCGKEDNFWSMGDTGPCGPCSEIHYYIGEDVKNQSEVDFRKDDGSYLEFWNLVFMQFNRSADGKMEALPKPSVDTGMGLERVVSIINNQKANYDTDTLREVIKTCEELSGVKYDGSSYEVKDLKKNKSYAQDVAMRVIADHSRAIAFLIADGVLPASDGRGYVLRRLIRRAIRHGKVLKFKDLFLAKTTTTVVEILGDVYPELKENNELIQKLTNSEERKFNETLDAGLEHLEKEVKKLKKGEVLSGQVAFLLHDTYGFPLDLTEDALKAHAVKVDRKGFDQEMSAQKERSREDRKSQNITFEAINISAPETKFLGYEKTECKAKLCQIEGDVLFFDQTCFYAESGGQVADTGSIKFDNAELEILDVQKVKGKYFAHQCKVISGSLDDKLLKKQAKLAVNSNRRSCIKANHSATHLVHSGLRKYLGEHIKQAGSRVDENTLRFDYSHFEGVSADVLSEIQDWVNTEIQNNYEVETELMSLDDAKQSGAIALFDEKYGDKVRVVTIGPNSKELCGGTHVSASGEIGSLIIKSEGGIAAGVRRIECFAGKSASQEVTRLVHEREKIADVLKSSTEELPEKVSKLSQKVKDLEKELEALKGNLAVSKTSILLDNTRKSPSGVKVIAETVDNLDTETLRGLVDRLRLKVGSGVVALGSSQGEVSVIVTGVTSDLTDKIHAGKILGEAAKEFGGKGGGRPDFAQAGGINNDSLNNALDKIFSLVA